MSKESFYNMTRNNLCTLRDMSGTEIAEPDAWGGYLPCVARFEKSLKYCITCFNDIRSDRKMETGMKLIIPHINMMMSVPEVVYGKEKDMLNSILFELGDVEMRHKHRGVYDECKKMC